MLFIYSGFGNHGCMFWSQMIRTEFPWNEAKSQKIDITYINHTIHVWYVYLHLVYFYGKCREIYTSPMYKQITSAEISVPYKTSGRPETSDDGPPVPNSRFAPSCSKEERREVERILVSCMHNKEATEMDWWMGRMDGWMDVCLFSFFVGGDGTVLYTIRGVCCFFFLGG